MDSTVLGALIGVGATILGVAITGLLTLLHDRTREHHERESFRTLLSVELLQNSTNLLMYRQVLEVTLDYPDARAVTVAFTVTTVPPRWEKARWSAPETGRHLTPSELMRIGEWYTKLDTATFLYERLIGQVRRLPTNDGKLVISPAFGEYVAGQLRYMLDDARELRDNPPPLPDAKLNSGETVRDYLDDLQRRHPDAYAKAKARGDAGGQ